MMDRELSKELCDALDALQGQRTDRTSALAMWKRVAEGETGAEVAIWCKEVAARLLLADDDADPKARPDSIMTAVGLAGKKDKHRDLRRVAQALDALGGTRAEIVEHLKAAGLVEKSTDKDEYRNVLDRELRKD